LLINGARKTIVMNLSHQDVAMVLFGTALAVFTEDATPRPATGRVNVTHLQQFSKGMDGGWVVYNVRPNDEVSYTRAAGALMTPLTSEEMETRQRVKELGLAA
jgi:predicted deacylase